MDILDLKNANLLTKNGSVNSAKIRRPTFQYTIIYNDILCETEWANILDPTIGFRIKSIILNITEIQYCECGKYCIPSKHKNKLFNETCGSRSCISSKSKYERTVEIRNKIGMAKLANKNSIINGFIDKYTNGLYNTVNTDSVIESKWGIANNRAIFDTIDYVENLDILASILKLTTHISIDSTDLRWSERIYCIKSNIFQHPTCRCGATLYFQNRFKGYTSMCRDCLLKYGPQLRAKSAIATAIDKISNKFNILNTPDGLNASTIRLQHIKCGHIFERWINNGRWVDVKCPKCECYTSKIESDILDMVSKWYPSNKTRIDNTEFDIYTKSKQLAIEVNGVYWHSEGNGKNRQYHLGKTKIANNNGIRLLHIFEDEILYKYPIVVNRLNNIFGQTKYKLYGRKCIINEISTTTKGKFLTKYHIQGNDRSSIKLGAFYKGRLVAVMTFGKRRFDKKDGYELVRYATISSFSCIGVAGKLLKHFELQYNPKAIISYADLRWSEGNVYKQLGFTHLHNSPPNYFYTKGSIRESRIKYQKHKLNALLDKFDPNMTEWENMKLNGYDRIWDCGNMVFEKTY